MTPRSIVLSTAALLLLSTVTPLQLGVSTTAAFAQEISAEVTAALSGDPAQLTPQQLRERIKLLRDAVQSGAFKGPDKKAVQKKIKAYRQVLQQHRAERQEARQDGQAAGQPEAKQQRARQQDGEPAQERKSERKAEKQAQQAERKAERQAQQQQPAQQAQAPAGAGLSPEMTAALGDSRPASALDPAELRSRVQALRAAVQSGALSRDQRRQVQARMQADREVLKSRRAARQEKAAPAEPREKQPRRATADETPKAEVEQRARAIIADDTPADDLDEKTLRKRLTENRAVLGTGKLSEAEERELRRQLRQDRQELRGRVASRQEEADEPASSTEVNTTTNVNIVIEQRTPSDRLSERELERRVRALNRALKEERLARRDAEIAREMVERDRRELRRRLHAERDRRRERRRQARSRNEVFIDFNIGHRPPQVIFAAEAMPRDIEVQLVAPPMRRMSRSYTVQEIAANHEVREMMPGIEIDTLNFDFGSAEVRPEEIDKLDDIADVIERIVAARPDEVFLIEGHTDAVGSDAANHALSQRRAHAVVEALLDYYAIDPENLQTVGLGERYLKIWTEEPEEENRRVTIRRITPLLAGGQG